MNTEKFNVQLNYMLKQDKLEHIQLHSYNKVNKCKDDYFEHHLSGHEIALKEVIEYIKTERDRKRIYKYIKNLYNKSRAYCRNIDKKYDIEEEKINKGLSNLTEDELNDLLFDKEYFIHDGMICVLYGIYRVCQGKLKYSKKDLLEYYQEVFNEVAPEYKDDVNNIFYGIVFDIEN